VYTCQQVGLNLFKKTPQADTINPMPLKLTERTIQKVQPRPPYRAQIADHIRQAIATGDLRPGEELPGEYEIAQTLHVDRATVRAGIADLVREGLLLREPGKRTKVAAPPVVRRLDTKRYAKQLAALRAGEPRDTAFIDDHDATWDAYTLDPLEYNEETASPDDQKWLHIGHNAKVMRRREVKRIDGEPMQIQRSAVPLHLAKGTILADPNVQPYIGGTLAELYDVGLIPDGSTLTVHEEAAGRAPNTTERRLLEMTVAAHVWDIVRVFSVDGVPVEASRVIAPMARIVLVYETELS